MIKPKHKFNGGIGATLCHHCSVIITVGLTDELYCDKCKNMKEQQKRLLTEVMELDQKNGLYKNQTAVEWLKNRLPSLFEHDHDDFYKRIFDHAKQMEKKQMEESWFDSTLQFDNAASMVDKKEFEQYYNETYGKE